MWNCLIPVPLRWSTKLSGRSLRRKRKSKHPEWKVMSQNRKWSSGDVAFQWCLYVNIFLQSQRFCWLKMILLQIWMSFIWKLNSKENPLCHMYRFKVVFVSSNHGTCLVSVFLRHMIQTDALLNQSLIVWPSEPHLCHWAPWTLTLKTSGRGLNLLPGNKSSQGLQNSNPPGSGL